jgi:site-specific DNA recombinase
MSISELSSKFQAIQQAKKPVIRSADISSGKGLAYGYIRVSTDKQADEGNSLEAQNSKIEEYCTSKDLKLVKIFSDPGVSAGIRKRPGLDAMIDSLIPGMKIIITDLDRIARNAEHFFNIKNMIHEHNCSIYIVNRSLDTQNADAQLLLGMLATIAEAERNNITTRIKYVMADMKTKGTLRMKPLFGYRIENKTLVECDEEQLVIKAIGDMITDNPLISNSSIAKILTENGFSLRRSRHIYPSTIANIIQRNHLRD